MGNNQKATCHRGPDSDKAILIYGTIGVENRNAQRVLKNRSGLFESNSMFFGINVAFLGSQSKSIMPLPYVPG